MTGSDAETTPPNGNDDLPGFLQLPFTPGVYGTMGKPAPENTPGSRLYSASWVDSNGNLWLFGGIGADSAGGVGGLGDLWEYTP